MQGCDQPGTRSRHERHVCTDWFPRALVGGEGESPWPAIDPDHKLQWLAWMDGPRKSQWSWPRAYGGGPPWSGVKKGINWCAEY